MSRFLLFLIVIAILLGVGGYYLGWFSVSVDESKIKQDTQVAQEKAREFGTKAREEAREFGHKAKEFLNKDAPAGSKTATGQIKEVDAAHRLVVRSGDEDLTFATDSATKVVGKSEAMRLDDLRVGDKVEVVYQQKDGKNVAVSVTVQ